MLRINIKSAQRLFRLLYLRLIRIHDTPQKIALGFSLGIFLGLMPGTGPLAALTLAVFFRVNRLTALLGSLATNTWLSIILLIPAIRTGAMMLRLDWTKLYADWMDIIYSLHWSLFFKSAFYKIVLPVFIGYVTIGFITASCAYALAIALITIKRHGNKDRSHLS